MGKKIQLFGELESVAVEKKLVDASQVKDSAWKDSTNVEGTTETTQSEINAKLRIAAETAASSASDLVLRYNKANRTLDLGTGTIPTDPEQEGADGYFKAQSSIDASAFIRDGMLKEVCGPVTPTKADLTDAAAVTGTTPTEATWCIVPPASEDADWDKAFYAYDPPKGALKIGKVTLGKTYLGFIWDTDTSNDTTNTPYSKDDFKASVLDVSTLFNEYEAGEGLEFLKLQSGVYKSPRTFTIKIAAKDSGSFSYEEKYLEFGSDGGLKTKGIDYIEQRAEDAKTALDTVNKNYDQIRSTLNSKLDSSAFTPVKTYVDQLRRVSKHRYAIVSGNSYEIPATVTGTNSVVGGDGTEAGEGYTVIRNVHVFYEGEEIVASVKYDYSSSNPFQNKKVTVAWSGITATASKPVFVTYERAAESIVGGGDGYDYKTS